MRILFENEMPYDLALADRVRDLLIADPGFTERKMFGGIAFMVDRSMCCGVVGEDLMLRLGREGADEALRQRHVRPMDFTGKTMTTMVYVEAEGVKGAALRRWVEKAVTFVGSLPTEDRTIGS